MRYLKLEVGGKLTNQDTKAQNRVPVLAGVITNMQAAGILAIKHGSLPQRFQSFEVELNGGDRKLVQVRGKLAETLKVEVGYSIEFSGVEFQPREVGGEWRGRFFIANTVTITSSEMSPYVAELIQLKKELEGRQ